MHARRGDIQAGLGTVSLEGEPQRVTEFLLTSLNAVPGKASMLEQLAKEAARPPAREALTWTHSRLIGNLDNVLKEIVHQNFKTKTIDELMSHSKLGFTEAVMDKLSLEAEEAKRRQLAQLAEHKNLSAEMLEDLSNAFDGKDAAAAGLISEGDARRDCRRGADLSTRGRARHTGGGPSGTVGPSAGNLCDEPGEAVR